MGGLAPLLPTGSQMAGAVYSANPLVSTGLGLLTSKPVSAGIGLLSGLGEMFGGSSDMASASSTATSGLGNVSFGSAGINRPIIDLSNPVNLAIAALGLVVAVYIYKKVV